MNMNNTLYNVLKWVAMVVLPALGTLYFALSTIWGLPFGEEVVGTITAVDTFLGAILGIASVNYSGEGVLMIDSKTSKTEVLLDTNVNELKDKKSVTLAVKPNTKLSRE